MTISICTCIGSKSKKVLKWWYINIYFFSHQKSFQPYQLQYLQFSLLSLFLSQPYFSQGKSIVLNESVKSF